LASYIQTQFYVVRVAPKSAEKDKSEPERFARRLAFNKFVETLLLTGVDTYTGDALTDNQGAIFVTSTEQADLLADQLNANPALRKLAQERGYADFAVSIHSVGVNPSEQKRRLKNYKDGKFLFVVGDDKFKEGFDHKPLKTIIDMPHGSLVDKAQILGRGTRQWYNPAKNRLEGMVFADTIIYIGSDDPKADRLARESAIANAVLASDVLDGNVLVMGPGAPTPTISKPQKTSLKIDWVDGITVEILSTLQDTKLLLSEREKFRCATPTIENWPESPEFKKLKALRINKGGIGARLLYRFYQSSEEAEDIFQSDSTIKRILLGWATKVSVREYEALLHLLEQLPDIITNWPQSPEYKALIDFRRSKGDVGSYTLFKEAQQDKEAKRVFTSPGLIDNILFGRDDTATASELGILTRLIEQQQDAIVNWPQSKEFKIITDLRSRKGNIGSRLLYQFAKSRKENGDIFKSENVIERILLGTAVKTTVKEYEAVLHLLDQWPDVIVNWPQSAEYNKLRDLREHKGNVGSYVLFKRAQQDIEAEGIFTNQIKIDNILNGKTDTVIASELGILTRLIEQQQDAIANWPQSKEFEALRSLRSRKGDIGCLSLFHSAQQDEGARDVFPSSGVVHNILLGKAKTVTNSQFETLTRLLEQQPDAIANWPQSKEFETLKALRLRKGNVGGQPLFQLALLDDKTKDVFTFHWDIARILSCKAKTVSRLQFETLVELLKQMPDKKLKSAVNACADEILKEETHPDLPGASLQKKGSVIGKTL
ncbi:MAG: hypothetical protein WC464_00860, partial [Bdellovibrionales bacterium]